MLYGSLTALKKYPDKAVTAVIAQPFVPRLSSLFLVHRGPPARISRKKLFQRSRQGSSHCDECILLYNNGIHIDRTSIVSWTGSWIVGSWIVDRNPDNRARYPAVGRHQREHHRKNKSRQEPDFFIHGCCILTVPSDDMASECLE